MDRPKISVIGAGVVGRQAAFAIANKELGDIVLMDIKERVAKGNALDLIEAAPLFGYDANIIGTSDIKKTKNSDVIVFTAGFPRKPGMTREELVSTNTKIVRDVSSKLAKLSPNAIIVMITNPLDVMTYVAQKATKFPKKRVMGMAGVLDSSRFQSFIAKELDVSIETVEALVLGSHGENMVPLPRLSNVSGVQLTELLPKSKINKLVKHTKQAGAEIVKLLEANAAISVGAAVAFMVEAILRDENRILNCSAYLNGQYGLKDLYLGVPVILGRSGIEKIIELKLTPDEKKQFQAAAKNIKALTQVAMKIN